MPSTSFTLKQSRELYRAYQQQILACDDEVETVLVGFEPRVNPDDKPTVAGGARVKPRRGECAATASERETIQQDRNRLINRLKGLLTTQGLLLPVDARVPTELERARLWDGTPIRTGKSLALHV
jgi:hypothetical protein